MPSLLPVVLYRCLYLLFQNTNLIPQHFSMYHKSIERYVNNQKSNLTKQLAVAVFSQSKPITGCSCQCWQLIITVEHILSIFVLKYNWNKIYNMLIFSYSQWIWSLTSCSPITLQVFLRSKYIGSAHYQWKLTLIGKIQTLSSHYLTSILSWIMWLELIKFAGQTCQAFLLDFY